MPLQPYFKCVKKDGSDEAQTNNKHNKKIHTEKHIAVTKDNQINSSWLIYK